MRVEVTTTGPGAVRMCGTIEPDLPIRGPPIRNTTSSQDEYTSDVAETAPAVTSLTAYSVTGVRRRRHQDSRSIDGRSSVALRRIAAAEACWAMSSRVATPRAWSSSSSRRSIVVPVVVGITSRTSTQYRKPPSNSSPPAANIRCSSRVSAAK